ncbi:MAG TPA: AI-2E family transporter, partial [Streptosporangiaceae bacterium]|nr:AI-2E family transporter [Streptosporangiaceae bacterium]
GRSDPGSGAEGADGSAAPFGLPGRPLSRGHPFFIGFVGALGVLLAYGLVQTVLRLSQLLTLILIALFLAAALDPVVRALQRLGLRRAAAVAVVFLGVIVVFVGFAAAIVPPVIKQATELAHQAPSLLDSLLRSSLVRRLDDQYGIITKASDELHNRLTNSDTVVLLFGGVLGAGKAVLTGFFGAFTVLVLTLYFLASLGTMTEAGYRLIPASRRERVRLLSDEVIRRVGSYVGGQITVASINAVCTFILLTILRLPYSLVLALIVGIIGLIPLVGATLGAAVVILVAVFHSWQYGVIVAVYYVVYQQVENYVIAPRVMARSVAVPGAVALVAALAGGALLGIVGALIAIPVAAGVLLIIREVVEPRQRAL